jgi:hypothetical protein
MKKAHLFYSDLYKENFVFMPGFTQKQVDSFTKKLKIESIDIEECEGKTMFCDGFVLIWSRYKDKSFESLSTLVHECIHASWMILDWKGIPVSLENDDTQAYLVEWILENCYKALK